MGEPRSPDGQHKLSLPGAMLVGWYELDNFGISLPIVRVAGGSIISAW